jgi:hypothetical protein
MSDTPVFAFTHPTKICPIHGKLVNGEWFTFRWEGQESDNYCMRCAMQLCEKLGVSKVSNPE